MFVLLAPLLFEQNLLFFFLCLVGSRRDTKKKYLMCYCLDFVVVVPNVYLYSMSKNRDYLEYLFL